MLSTTPHSRADSVSCQGPVLRLHELQAVQEAVLGHLQDQEGDGQEGRPEEIADLWVRYINNNPF